MNKTASEFKINNSKIEITTSKPDNPKISSVDAISGILKGKVPSNIDRYKVREERLKK